MERETSLFSCLKGGKNMEENNTLKEKLIEKLNAEYAMLGEELRASGVDNFMERGYEYFTKQEIIDYLQYSEISEDSIKALLKSNDLLEQIYDEWLKTDGNFYEVLDVPINNVMDSIEFDYKEKLKSKDRER